MVLNELVWKRRNRDREVCGCKHIPTGNVRVGTETSMNTVVIRLPLSSSLTSISSVSRPIKRGKKKKTLRKRRNVGRASRSRSHILCPLHNARSISSEDRKLFSGSTLHPLKPYILCREKKKTFCFLNENLNQMGSKTIQQGQFKSKS